LRRKGYVRFTVTAQTCGFASLTIIRYGLAALLCTLSAGAWARGVSPYLPLNLEPEIERKIERVLELADKPVMTRPIPAAAVLDALPRACAIDPVLCGQVRNFLARYEHNAGTSYASAELSASHGPSEVLPNEHGLESGSHYDVDAAVYWQPFDHALLSLGGITYQGRTVPTGTMLSLGFDSLQLDVGWRDHWWSPMSDSAMLISTEAPTMPSVTLSNYRPLTPLGISYELFVARMSEQEVRLTNGQIVNASPKFAGLHLTMEPVRGWSLGADRIVTYGGGPSLSVSQVLDAFFNPSKGQTTGFDGRSVNKQQAEVTSRFIFPGPVPFAFYVEYAGNDTGRGKNYLLGSPALSAGIHFPRIGPFDITYEISDWVNSWYLVLGTSVQNAYLGGLTNDARTIGNWFGDQRQFGDAVGGQTNMVRVDWQPPFGGVLEEQIREITNAAYSTVQYKHGYEGLIRYSYPWRGLTVGGEVDLGRDVFAGHFERIAAFMRLGNESLSSPSDSDATAAQALDARGTELFVDAGAYGYRLETDLSNVVPHTESGTSYAPHLGAGARRAVTDSQDLGVRVEFDEIKSHPLIAVRMIDYRYRILGPLAVGAFFGAARYAVGTPAYGWYLGGGLQYRNVLPGWDLGADYRYEVEMQRDHVLPSDPVGNRPDSFYNVQGISLYVSRHF
jgi:hypothetical protein